MDALILVDLQYDFMPGGALGVKGGNEIIPVINRIIGKFALVIASQDWHPEDHVSFAEIHGKKPGETLEIDGEKIDLWPRHCVQGTHGASLVKELNTDQIHKYVYKGIHPRDLGYSVFSETGLDGYLREKKVTKLYFAGLTTDYCVKESTLDAIELGYEVRVIVDACKAVKDEEKALEEIKKAGGKLTTSKIL